MKGPISFWEYKKQESNLILPEHDDDDDDDDDDVKGLSALRVLNISNTVDMWRHSNW